MRKDKLLDSLNSGDHVWSTDVLEVNEKWKSEAEDDPQVPITYCHSLSPSIDLLQFHLNSLMDG